VSTSSIYLSISAGLVVRRFRFLPHTTTYNSSFSLSVAAIVDRSIIQTMKLATATILFSATSALAFAPATQQRAFGRTALFATETATETKVRENIPSDGGDDIAHKNGLACF
jgi:hypothetical protein